MSFITQAQKLGQEKPSRSKLLHHEVDIALTGSQAVRTVVVLTSREAKSHFHHGLIALLSLVVFVNKFEALNDAVETRTEGPLEAITGETVVFVLCFLLESAWKEKG
jgi:hypothetical protein